MIEMRKHIRQSLSTRLCLSILFVVVLVFSLSLGFLYWQSRNIIRAEAIDEASHVLDNTALRVKGYMVEVETATRNILWLVNLHTHDQDSLLKYTHRIVANHPNTNGCSITMEPNFYPGEDYGFSAYSVHLEGHSSASGKDSVAPCAKPTTTIIIRYGIRFRARSGMPAGWTPSTTTMPAPSQTPS